MSSQSDLIAVALSGGVDSAVVAALLKQQGRNLIGITMTLLDNQDSGDKAQLVADHLRIPLVRVDVREVFSQQVITPFVASYLDGETPNPCVRCNRLIKFGALLEQATLLGADRLATGHYARIVADADGTPHLLAAVDIRKDQSYFLGAIGRDALARAFFPLGEMSGKDEVRQYARQFDIPVAEARDSQDVCFLSDAGYVPFLASRSEVTPAKGLIVHRNGKLLGRHDGFWRYTVGQRKGLGIAWSEPLYVLELQASRNRVVVGEERYLYAAGLCADGMQWLCKPADSSFNALCKIRYRQAPVACRVDAGEADGSISLLFEQPQRAVTPGQTVVLYRGDEVLGAARIAEAIPC